MASVYGPARLPLAHPVTTRLIDALWKEEVDARAIREANDEILIRHVLETLLGGDGECVGSTTGVDDGH